LPHLVRVGCRQFDHADGVARQQQRLRIGNRHDHESAVVVVDAHLEDRGDAVGDLSRYRAEGRGPPLRIDHRDRIADLRAEILRKLRADRDVVLAHFQRGETAGLHLALQAVNVRLRIAAHENGLDPAIEAGEQRLFDQRRGAGNARRLAHVLQNVLPSITATRLMPATSAIKRSPLPGSM